MRRTGLRIYTLNHTGIYNTLKPKLTKKFHALQFKRQKAYDKFGKNITSKINYAYTSIYQRMNRCAYRR